MKPEDKETFEKWHYDNVSNPPTLNDLIQKAWQDACLYKQKEIDELQWELAVAVDALEKISNDRSPPWDKMNYQSKTREALEKIRGRNEE